MSNPIVVKSIDVSDVRKQLKGCPKDVVNYVRALEESSQGWQNLISLQNTMLDNCRKEIKKLKKERK